MIGADAGCTTRPSSPVPVTIFDCTIKRALKQRLESQASSSLSQQVKTCPQLQAEVERQHKVFKQRQKQKEEAEAEAKAKVEAEANAEPEDSVKAEAEAAAEPKAKVGAEG